MLMLIYEWMMLRLMQCKCKSASLTPMVLHWQLLNVHLGWSQGKNCSSVIPITSCVCMPWLSWTLIGELQMLIKEHHIAEGRYIYYLFWYQRCIINNCNYKFLSFFGYLMIQFWEFSVVQAVFCLYDAQWAIHVTIFF